MSTSPRLQLNETTSSQEQSPPSSTASNSTAESAASTTATNMTPPLDPTMTANIDGTDDNFNTINNIDNDDDDDIWATTPPHSPTLHPSHSNEPHHQSNTTASTESTTNPDHSNIHNNTRGPKREELLSDIPHLRRQHMTSGYREGLGVGKARVMQQGFDDGYPLGISLGWRCGRVLGVLEGWVAGLGDGGDKVGEDGKGGGGKAGKGQRGVRDGHGVSAAATATSTTITPESTNPTINAGSESDLEARRKLRKEIQRLLETARDELAVTSLMSGVSDEVVHEMRSDAAGAEASAALPIQIETTVRRWEDLVLGQGG